MWQRVAGAGARPDAEQHDGAEGDDAEQTQADLAAAARVPPECLAVRAKRGDEGPAMAEEAIRAKVELHV